MKSILAVSLCLLAVACGQVRYDGFKVFRAIPTNEAQIRALRSLEELNQGFSFWTSASAVEQPVDIMVPPHLLLDFQDAMKLENIAYTVFMDNVQENIEGSLAKTFDGEKAFGWTQYHTLEEIQNWLRQLAQRFPDKVTVVKGGRSYEGRDILGVHVSFKRENANRAIFIEGGIHAREWISPATVTYMLNEFMTSTDPKVRNLAESYDWYIFPNFNPDGYVYTHTQNRLWRKTRTPYGSCYGVDPNRNWGFHWNEGGTSSNPCSETYSGPRAFSEIETKSMSEYITSIRSKLIAYIGFHSYSQLLLIPYGHSSAHVENYNELYSVGLKMRNSLAARYGTRYTVGNIVEVIYVASGGSMDWVKGNYKTRITYTYELRDTGRYGFLLPPNQIIPTGQETLDSMVTMMEEFSK